MKGRLTPSTLFFWQGVLIVLPAVVLAIFGLAALQQDRLLVRQQAIEQARKAANDAVQVLLPAALVVTPPSATEFPDRSAVPLRPSDDMVLSAAKRTPGWTVCLIDTAGNLLYPPSEGPRLQTETESPEALSEALRLAWITAQAAELRPDAAKDVIAEYERFLTGSPPNGFAAQAIYRIGVLSANCGQIQQARDRFTQLRREMPNVLSGAGVPLALYSAWQLLKLPGESVGTGESRENLLNSMCGQAVVRFPILAPTILDDVGEDHGVDQPEVQRWREVLFAHRQARGVHVAWCARVEAGSNPQWIGRAANESWLVLSVPTGSNAWLMALPETAAKQWLANSVSDSLLPKYLRAQVRLAGRWLSEDQGEELATAEMPGSRTRPEATVRVSLVNPGLLYDRQRARTCWFGGLIGLALVSMSLGFVAAWRAFRRQQELSALKSNFVSSVSHELRAPIASVRLMAEELSDIEAGDPDKTRSYHEFIVQECRRLSALIENVLDFSRHEQGRKEYQFEPTNLPALVESTATLMRNYAAEKQITIATQLPEEPIEIEADGRAVQQVLVNLIDNAIKHSPAGSVITVGLDEQPASDKCKARRLSLFARWRGTGQVPGTVCLWVEDHGEGIPMEEQARIFERFYRPGSELQRRTPGVGLGLAIVQYVTQAHGGRVTVRSTVGNGSRFTIELPFNNPSSRHERL